MSRVFLLITVFLTCLQFISAQEFEQKGIGTDADETGHLQLVRDQLFIIGSTSQSNTKNLLIAKLDNDLGINWSKTIDNSSDEIGTSLLSFGSNDLFLTGIDENGGSFYTRINSSGQVQHSQKLGVSGDHIDQFMATSDGGYLGMGYLESLAPGNRKGGIIKLNASLEMEWRHYYDYELSTDFDDNFAMSIVSGVELNRKDYIFLASYYSLNNPEDARLRLIKVNERGYLEWVTGYHGGKSDQATDMLKLDDDSYIIMATTTSYGAGGKDILLMNIDPLGGVNWSKTIDSAQDDVAGQIISLPSGGFALCGSSSNIGFGKSDALLILLNEDANPQSAHVYGGLEDEHASHLVIHDSKIIISGQTKSFGDGDQDIYLVSTNLDGRSDDCGADVTDVFSTQNVSTTFFEGNYAHSAFDVPVDFTLTSQDISLDSKFSCYQCPPNTNTNRFLCEGESLTLDFSSNIETEYKWQDGSNGATLLVTQPGLYWVESTTEWCVSRDTIVVKEIRQQSLDLGGDQKICKGERVLLKASVNGAIRYTWQDGSEDSTLVADKPGIYSVSVLTTCGTLSDQVELSTPAFDYHIPNVFTPNGDQINDFFEIQSISTNIQSLKVFNRMGKLVYQSDDYTGKWNGSGLTSGVYYYLFVDECTGQKFKGWLQIIK